VINVTRRGNATMNHKQTGIGRGWKRLDAKKGKKVRRKARML
jgi:hypothetical protein